MDDTLLFSVVTLGTGLSLISCLTIIISYVFFKKLRNLFYRITLYHAILQVIQVVGLEASILFRFTNFYKIVSEHIYCQYFAYIRIYGAMGSLTFSLIQLHQIVRALNKFESKQSQNLDGGPKSEIINQVSFETTYLLMGFFLPLLFVQIPLWDKLVTPHMDLCYIYVLEGQSMAKKITEIIVIVLMWDGPLFIYIVYGFWIARKIKNLFSEYEDELKNSMKHLVKQFYTNIGLTVCATLPYTIANILQISSQKDQSGYLLPISLFILSIWGLMDSINIWVTNIEMQYQFKIKFGFIKEEDDVMDENRTQSLQLINRETLDPYGSEETEEQQGFYRGNDEDSDQLRQSFFLKLSNKQKDDENKL